MFETAELGQTTPKRVFKKAAPVLRQQLLELQAELRELGHLQVIVLFAGVDGAGKGETVSVLNAWMDPRWLQTRAYDAPADLERERPELWRYWLELPPRGRVGLFLSAWYSAPVLDRVYQRSDEASFEKRLDRIVSFERMLADDGALILKFWMHLSHAAQEQRLKALEADPLTPDWVIESDWENWRQYDRFIAAAERVVARTSTGPAPWHIVEGLDPRFRCLTVGGIIRDALRPRIEQEVQARRAQAAPAARPRKRKARKARKAGAAGEEAVPARGAARRHPGVVPATVLDQLDMSLSVPKARYAEALAALQTRLRVLHYAARNRGVSTLVVFEGPDAAGKGGAIRRLTGALAARNYQVHGFAAPSDEERAQHYLWRFWRRLPRAGHIDIFDRSWYGRVLVERVEGLAAEAAWRRAYAEINDFEEQLTSHGIVLLKYWIHVTADEQLARFRVREQTPYKRWKLTPEDWRNRERWHDYELAVHDMVQHTSSQLAPWTLVEGNDKRHARIKVLRTLCERLEARLEHAGAAVT